MRTPGVRFLAVAILLALCAACGKKGPPQAPLRPVPAAVSDLSIERVGAVVTLQFTLPETNLDGSTPPALERVELFGLTLAADVTAPTAAQLVVPANLVTSVAVRSVDEVKPGAPPDPRPAPGGVARVVDTIAAPRAGAAVPLIRYYAVVTTSGRRRGSPAGIHPVPLSVDPDSPGGLKADYTETTLTVAWQPMTATQRFLVEETDRSGAQGKRLSSSPIEATSLDVPIQFGETRCFVVRAVDRRQAVSVLGAPTAPLCVAITDRFAPPAPTGLVAGPGDGSIDLSWKASVAPDLAGYVVLRGDGANGTLQPLTPTPVAVTTYRDLTVRPGSTYVYAVVAVDKATPPNRSAESNREVVTARQPATREQR